MESFEYITVQCFDGIERSGFKVKRVPKTAHLVSCCYDSNYNAFNIYSTGKRQYIKFTNV